MDMMGQTLTRPDDRALFDLDGKGENAKDETTPAAGQTIKPPVLDGQGNDYREASTI
jgi:hypothetical protein